MPKPSTAAHARRAGASAAFAFVLAMGIVNLFGDTTDEGGASINAQFLAYMRRPPDRW
jgi:hypothetical protein